jgi:hypothetical protein
MTALTTDTAYRAVDFIETYTGLPFYPLKPDTEHISIIDIAHALSHQCRYSGHTKDFYSTAQHCCLLAEYVESTMRGSTLDALNILMHDSAEAYLVDIPRPVKQFMPEYRKWDHNITMAVRSWVGLGDMPIPPWQDELDSRIIRDERAQLFGDSGLDWQHKVEPLGITINPWTAETAERQFLIRYANYTRTIYGKHQYLRAKWGIAIEAKFKPAAFASGGGDILLTDLFEVDIRGRTGRIAARTADGKMVVDKDAGTFPRPLCKWVHGDFEILDIGQSEWARNVGEKE